nr:pectinesterase 3 [Quercus suber]
MTQMKEFLATKYESTTKHISISKKKKKLFLSLFATLLVVAAVIGIVAGVTKSHNNSSHNEISAAAHAILKSSCSSTLYPDLCYSAIATVPGATAQLASKKDVIEKSLNLTTKAVEQNFKVIKKLTKTKHLTKREKVALHDCLETIDETLDELHDAVEDLHLYPTKKSLSQHADDLKTLISSAITNQETCIDGFSHDGGDKHIRQALLAGQTHVERMCSNALAMIKNMTDTDMAIQRMKMQNRKLKEDDIGDESIKWPEWLSAGDRRLLQSSSLTPNVVVAADGSGNYKTVSAAVAAAPDNGKTRYIIKIKAGVYRENVEVTKKKKFIMFLGDGRSNTIITGNKNVVDGSTTFKSATVAVVGERFLARDLTFENTAGSSKHQAVALRVGSDFSAFYQCDMLAHQDTLYLCSKIVTSHARRPNAGQKNMVTAQGRIDPNQNTGIVIQKCRIGATNDLKSVQSSFPTYLGRPWKEYSRTVIMQTSISDVIHPEGWHIWNGEFALKTLFYGEYLNTGAGAGTAQRVNWGGFKVMGASDAQSFTAGNFIGGSSWLGSTGFPFSLGL